MSDDGAGERSLPVSDPGYLAETYDIYSSRVYGLALGLLRVPAEAEDIVQQAFLALLTHADRIERRSVVGTWLYRVAYNGCMDRLRARRELPLYDDGEDATAEDGTLPLLEALVSSDFNPEAAALDAEARSALDAAIQALPGPHRAALILRDVDGLTNAEAAEVLGISVSLTKARLRRARLALRVRLAAYFRERRYVEAR
jgi:RNA polymerase sigma-70 factor, ECF subfamily